MSPSARFCNRLTKAASISRELLAFFPKGGSPKQATPLPHQQLPSPPEIVSKRVFGDEPCINLRISRALPTGGGAAHTTSRPVQKKSVLRFIEAHLRCAAPCAGSWAVFGRRSGAQFSPAPSDGNG